MKPYDHAVSAMRGFYRRHRYVAPVQVEESIRNVIDMAFRFAKPALA
jgi:hypothetical protein